jgi:effector-binding domain-containing protein
VGASGSRTHSRAWAWDRARDGNLVAEIVHDGPFDEAGVQDIKRLQRFIFDCGYEIAGDPEEEYLTRPSEEPQRTIVRYEIRQAPHR